MNGTKGKEGSKRGKKTKFRHAAVVVAVAVAVFLGVAGTAAAQTTTAPDCSTVGYDGDGTTTNPYEVTNVSQLQCMGNSTTSTSLSDNFTQTSNIDATGTNQWNGGAGFDPIGTDSNRFTGTFDGSNHTITALTIDRTNAAIGLFGATGTDAEIEDVTLSNADMTYGDSFNGGGVLVGNNKGTVTNVSASGAMVVADSGFDAGGLVGINEGTIAYSEADMDVSDGTGNIGNVGGLAGTQQSGGTIHNSSATGDVLINDNRVGGLVGSNGQFGVAVIRDSYATGDVEGTSSVGGLAGDQQSFDAVIKRSYATGSVTGDDAQIGGLVGDQSRGSIEDSYATGSVTGEGGANNVGGFIGANAGTINGSYANGTVTGTDGVGDPSEQVGGFVGFNQDGMITEAFAEGDITGTNNVGGFVGENTDDFASAVVRESYATGSVSGDNAVGGFVGANDGTVTDVYSRGDVVGDKEVGGVAGRNNDQSGSGIVVRTYATGGVTGNTNVSGVVGFNEGGDVTDSYWDELATGQTNAVGASGPDGSESNLVGFSSDSDGDTRADEMIGAAAETNMTAFNFTTTWATVIDDYPILAWQGTTNPAPVCSNVGYNGAGTASDPFRVTNVSQLQCIGDADTSTSLTDSFEQTSDIDATNTSLWNNGLGFEPVGNLTDPFEGTYNGAGNNITGLTIDRPSENDIGLFGGTNGTVTDTGLENADVTGDDIVGTIAGFNSGVIESSEASGTVTGSADVGGFVGGNSGSAPGSVGRINESATTADVVGGNNVGGNVGGFVGANRNGLLEDVYARGNVTGDQSVGGVAGVNGGPSGISGTVNRAYATGNVTGNSDVGGVVGFNLGNGDVNDSYWDELATGQTGAVGASGSGASESNLVGFSSDTDNDDRADEMIGSAAVTNMTAFDFTTTWATVTDDYPILAFQAQETQSQDISTCGVTITSSGAFELTQDITASTNCVEITASDVLLNGNGNSVTGAAGNGATGIIFADGVNNVTVENIVVSDWDVSGIDTGEGSDNNAIRDVTVRNSTGDALEIGGSNVVVENLNIGDSTAPGTTLSFVGTNVTLDNVENPPADPDDSESIGRYFNADNTSPNGQLNNLELEYDEADLNGADESTLTLLNFDGTQWQPVPGSSVDEANNVLTATITDFSTFGGFSSAELADFDVNITETTSPINAGENLDVSANITNTGTSTDNATVELIVNGTVRDTREKILTPGSSAEIVLTWNTNETDFGDYLAEVDVQGGGADAEPVRVDGPETDPKFEVDITGTTEPVQAGETLGVETTVENVGDRKGTQEVELIVDGTERDNETVNLDGGDSSTVALEWETTESDAGDVLAEVNTSRDRTTSEVSIGPPPTDPVFDVEIPDTTEPVQAGDTLEAEAFVENVGDTASNGTIELVANGSVQDTDTVNLSASGQPGSADRVVLEWATTEADAGDRIIQAGARDKPGLDATDVVTVEEPPEPPTDANFEPTIESTTSTVVEGNTLAVEATIENTGDRTGFQPISLNVGGAERDNETLELDGGESRTIILNWETTTGDAGGYLAKVTTPDGTATETVTVEEPSESDFVVGITGTTEPVTAGETLGVDVSVENTGDTAGTETVELFANGSVRDSRTVSLDGGDSRSIALEWDTTEEDAGETLIEVRTPNASATERVTIGAPPEPPTDAKFLVDIVGTTEPVQAGETLGVEALVENTGETTGTETVELIVNGTTRDTDTVPLDGGDSSTVALEWETTVADAGSVLVEVNATRDRATREVTIGPPPTDAAFDISIDSTTNPIQAGERVEVDATVENVGGTPDNGTIELIANGSVRDTEDVDLSASGTPGDTDTVALSWDTTEDDAGDRIVQVDTADEGKGLAATETVTIGAPPTDANLAVDIITTTEPVRAGDTLEVEALVENTGETTGTGLVSLNASGEKRDSATVELDPGETDDIVLSWDTTEGDAGDTIARVSTPDDTDTTPVTIGEAPEEAEFDVKINSATETDAGGTLAVQATVENVGDEPGTDEAVLEIGGAERDNETVGLRPGDTRTVVLRWNTAEDDAGDYVAEVITSNDTATTPVTVGGPPTEPTFEVEITGTTAPVAAGDELAVEAIVENAGDTAGTGTVELSADGASEDSETVELDPGETRSVVLLWDTAADEGDVGSAVLKVSTSDDTSTTNVEVGDLPTDAKFDVSIERTTAPVQAGDTVEAEATVENVGETPGNVNVDLLAAGAVQDSETVSLDPGDSRPVALRWKTNEDDVGEFILTAEGPKLGGTAVVNIEEPPTDPEFKVEITTTTSPVKEEEALEVVATVKNVGDTAGSALVTLNIDGQTPDTEAASLRPGNSRPVKLRWAPTEGDVGEFIAQIETDDDGAVALVTVESGNQAPVASFEAFPENPGVGESVTFTSSSLDLDGSIQLRQWDLDGDGSIDETTTSSTVARSYDRSGTFPVTLTVTDDEGATNSTTVDVEVRVFTEPLLPEFNSPPTNTQDLDPTLYEDVNGDGDGLDPSEAVLLWSQLVQSPEDFDDLTQAQVDALDWNNDGDLTSADAVILWSEKVQAQAGS